MSDRDENTQDVMETLQKLAPAPVDAPQPASLALAELRRRAAPTPRNRSWTVPAVFGRRYAWAALLVIMALAFTSMFPGVRAAASDFLGLFRVQKFTPADLHYLADLLIQGHAGE